MTESLSSRDATGATDGWDAWFDAEPAAPSQTAIDNDVAALMTSMWRVLAVDAAIVALGLLVVVAISWRR